MKKHKTFYIEWDDSECRSCEHHVCQIFKQGDDSRMGFSAWYGCPMVEIIKVIKKNASR